MYLLLSLLLLKNNNFITIIIITIIIILRVFYHSQVLKQKSIIYSQFQCQISLLNPVMTLTSFEVISKMPIVMMIIIIIIY